ncbi:MAG: carbohydrate-binding domain-containing protein [Actinomycetaceae bacterium]|nr:carbohydrate-binding domain-containing protein [Actinomycetaceae bacterium]
MKATTKKWLVATLAAGLTLGACGQDGGSDPTGSGTGDSTNANGSNETFEGVEGLNKIRDVSEKSVPTPTGDVYAGSVKPTEASVEALMAENQKPHADSNDVEYKEAEATKIALDGESAKVDGQGAKAADGKVTISSEGTYILSGTFKGEVVVEANKKEKVHIVLDNANIESTKDSAIRVLEAKEAIVVLADGSTNSLKDSASYESTVDNGPIAALASKADLTIGGGGTLEVNGQTNDGISGSDGVVVVGGTINVTSVDDAIRGKDYVVIADGTFNLQAGSDGIKSDNDTDSGRGYVLIMGGDATINSAEDAVGATSDLIVSGGKITVTETKEGFESSKMLLAGGSADITASDDGLNTVDGKEPWLAITGGEWTLNTEGDGFDSNGKGHISDGKVTIYGPSATGNAAIDIQDGLTVSGGTLFAVGAVGKDVTPKAEGDQSAVKFQADVAEGSTVAIQDASGNELASYTSPKKAGSIIYSGPGIAKGQEYKVAINGQEAATAKGGEG